MVNVSFSTASCWREGMLVGAAAGLDAGLAGGFTAGLNAGFAGGFTAGLDAGFAAVGMGDRGSAFTVRVDSGLKP